MQATESATRTWADDPVRRQAVASLEAHHRELGSRADDAIDRAPVDMVMPERHLQPRDGGPSGGMRGRHRQQSGGDAQNESEPRHPSHEGSAGRPKSLGVAGSSRD